MQGIRLEGKKESSLVFWTLGKIKLPQKVVIPLRHSAEPPSVPIVHVGDSVKAGQPISRPDHLMSLACHSSISGTVSVIEERPHSFGEPELAVVIEADGKELIAENVGQERIGWESLDADQLHAVFRENGLVEMSQDMLPLHWKAQDARRHKIHTLVLNACESEPYVTSDHSLFMSHPVEILKGAEIFRKAIAADKVIIAIQKDKLEVAELIKSKIYFLKWNNYEVKILPNRYPHGLTLPLINTLFGIHLSPRVRHLRQDSREGVAAMLFDRATHEQGVCILSAPTAYATYEAVALQKPLYERAVTVTGECVIEPRNFLVPIGLSVEETLKAARGVMREPGRLIFGGPMQGRLIDDMNLPVLKGVNAIVALPKEITKVGNVSPCSHCNRCVEACPVDISPVMITLSAEHDFFEDAREWGIDACIKCGNCTYVCPANRPMAELIEYARQSLEEN